MNEVMPDRSEAYRRALSACHAGKLAEAEARCCQIVAAEPEFFDALHLLAFVQSRLGKPDAALASYDRAAELRPDHAEVLFSRGVVLQQLSRFDEALASYDRLVAVRPDHADALYNRGVVLHQLDRDEEALATYDRAIAVRPGHAGALSNRGNILHRLRRFAAAVASFDGAIAVQPDDAEALSNRGVSLHALKRYEEAVASFDRAIAVKPDYAAAFHKRAVALQQLRRFEEAVASYEQALLLRSGGTRPPSRPQLRASSPAAVRTTPAVRNGTFTVLSYCGAAPIGPDAVGGAEQVLGMLDRALVEAGHRSIVVACEGSRTAGALVAVPHPPHSGNRAAVEARHRAAILAALERWPVDLIHSHGLHLHANLSVPGIPTLATLHMPLEFYDLEALRPRPDRFLHCVSPRQHAGCGKLAHMLQMLPPIENGIVVEDYHGVHARRGFALLLCRICPEKGVHLAIDAAKRAGVPLLIAGEVAPEPDLEAYFVAEVQPRLDRARRLIGRIGERRKRRLLAAARCLLVPSLVAETSSLVAREALAAGTPVVAYPAGALVDVVDHGRTGYLVEDVPQMAEAIAACAGLDAALCRRVARERFSARRMIEQYFNVYAELTGMHRGQLAASPS
jgi:glycosyltransferase involved in cell wall biosynthesis/Tfp pilus assembly protein PilF